MILSILRVFLLACIPIVAMTQNGLDHMLRAITNMEDGQELRISYAVYGCFGPYQFGEITLIQTGEEIKVVAIKKELSKDKQSITQRNQFSKKDLLTSLKVANEKDGEMILGNTVAYELYLDRKRIEENKLPFEKKHVLDVFYPFQQFTIQF